MPDKDKILNSEKSSPKNEIFVNQLHEEKANQEKYKEVVTRQPEKEELISSLDEKVDSTSPLPVNKPDDTAECATCVILCCNFMEQCWLSLCPCVNECCDCGAVACIDGTCEACVACLEGCGDCCTQC